MQLWQQQERLQGRTAGQGREARPHAQVNSFRERTESVKDAEIDPEDKMVLVVNRESADGAKPLTA